MVWLAQIEERVKAATPGKSWINMLQSNGCEVQLYDQTYTIHLACKYGEDFKQTERDAELLINARTDIEILLKRDKIMREALEWYAKWDWSDKYVQAIPKRAREALAAADGVVDGK